MNSNIPTEAQEQKAVFEWSMYNRAKYPELALMFHIVNEGKRDAITGRHLKQQGMKKGVPDICLPVARKGYHGLYIEMKRKNGRPSPEQLWWQDRLREQKYKAEICHGWEEAVEVLEDYLK